MSACTERCSMSFISLVECGFFLFCSHVLGQKLRKLIKKAVCVLGMAGAPGADFGNMNVAQVSQYNG